MEEIFIPLSVPNLKGNELNYVSNAVKTEWVSTAGTYVTNFEQSVSDYVSSGCVACQSGTAGLHVALRLCGVGQGDMVIVPTLTFIASVNPIIYQNATPIFMDCDDSLCIDPDKLMQFCEEECTLRDGILYYKKNGAVIKAAIVVHIFGNMADMERLVLIAKKYHFKLIEDAAEALGTKYVEGKYAGRFAGTIGDVGVYSFNGNKIITTGGGGMIVSSDVSLLKRAKHLTTQAKRDPEFFIHDEIGYNYRLTNLQAALGLAQMESLEDFILAKNQNYLFYKQQLEQINGLKLLSFRKGVRSNCWFYALYCESPFSRSPRELIEGLKKRFIQSRPIWGLIHEQEPYREFDSYKIEKAKRYRDHVVNIPCSTNLLQKDLVRVIDAIKEMV